MAASEQIIPFDWQRILWSVESPAFLGEVVVRCIVMYLLVLGVLRVTGRRGVRQLSIFELSIILALGSAAGDAMFYSDVPLMHVLVVFVVVPLLYVAFNKLTERSPAFSNWLEGATVCLVSEGLVEITTFKQQNLTQKELFGELRQHQVEHLGQVRRMYIEATGNVSVYFYPDAEVRPGLPIWPELLRAAQLEITEAGSYSCCVCGRTHTLTPGKHTCSACQNQRWVPSCDTKRQA